MREGRWNNCTEVLSSVPPQNYLFRVKWEGENIIYRASKFLPADLSLELRLFRPTEDLALCIQSPLMERAEPSKISGTVKTPDWQNLLACPLSWWKWWKQPWYSIFSIKRRTHLSWMVELIFSRLSSYFQDFQDFPCTNETLLACRELYAFHSKLC